MLVGVDSAEGLAKTLGGTVDILRKNAHIPGNGFCTLITQYGIDAAGKDDALAASAPRRLETVITTDDIEIEIELRSVKIGLLPAIGGQVHEHVHVLTCGGEGVEIGDIQLGEFFMGLQVFNRANIGQAEGVAVAPVLAQDSAD